MSWRGHNISGEIRSQANLHGPSCMGCMVSPARGAVFIATRVPMIQRTPLGAPHIALLKELHELAPAAFYKHLAANGAKKCRWRLSDPTFETNPDHSLPNVCVYRRVS